MSKRTLGKARGLNSIADPSAFKGSSGRRRAPEAETPPPPPPPPPAPEPEIVTEETAEETVVEETVVAETAIDESAAPEPTPDASTEAPVAETQVAETYVADTSTDESYQVEVATETVAQTPAPTQTAEPAPAKRASSRGAIGARKRRELSVPIPVAEAVEATGVNPADLVMAAYNKHSDSLYAGSGGRMVSRGRQRLRVSISDSDFAKITRLGETRGWNRSETVAVLLTLELEAKIN